MKKSKPENALPLEELSALGLYDGGKLLLKDEDISALLSGRRTGLMSLKNLQNDAFRVDQMDAKLSLSGEGIKIHPVYHKALPPAELGDAEIEKLQKGEAFGYLKRVQLKGEQPKTVVFEYDDETREFISYEPKNVQVPEAVNDELLTPDQKEGFKRGLPVELSDGTRIVHKATEPNGILSDRMALVLSVLLDGGISYLLLRGINAISKIDALQRSPFTPGFGKALEKMQQSMVDGQTSELSKGDLENYRMQHAKSQGMGTSR